MDPSVDTIKCTYQHGKQQESPHIHIPFRPVQPKICEDVLDAIGNTPLIRINKIGKQEEVQCQILAKCEFMNMGGSVKDRIGKRMVLDGEKRGLLKQGAKIVQATSGNAGIGLALASSVRGYQITIAMPQKMSMEKANVLKSLGAKIIRTPNDAAFDDPRSHISVSRKLQKQEGYILLDQYSNPSNPISHYDQLAEQILYQCDGKVDAIVAGTGTGGTMTGVARKIKQKNPEAIMVGVDPCGSILAMPQKLNQGKYPVNKIEGIGYDFVPRTCQRVLIDHWIKTLDPESFKYARDLIKKEGLLVGGSSGSVMAGAMRFIKEKGWQNDKTKRVVCIFSDSIRNYISKFVSKEWCVEYGFQPYESLNEEGHIFNGISLQQMNLPEIQSFEDLTVGHAKQIFEKGGKIIPLRKEGEIYGAIFPRKFIQLINLKKLKLTDSAIATKFNDFVIVPNTLNVSQLEKLLERNEAVLVATRNAQNKIEKLQVATIADTFKFLK